MSGIQVGGNVAWVLEWFDGKPATRMIAVIMAHAADRSPDGTACLAVADVAHQARTSERTASRHIQKLRRLGMLQLQGTGHGGLERHKDGVRVGLKSRYSFVQTASGGAR